jgi:RNA polymerase sigma-70 factor (ECF subfamily)
MRSSERFRSDAELLAATRVEADAFGAFYRRHERPILGYLLARVRDAELAADLASEVFTAALEAAGTFDPGRSESGSASGWLFSIAHNTLVSSVRRGRVAEAARRRLGALEPLALEDEDIERVNALQAGERWVDLLGELPAGEREAILGRVLQERDYGEIAEEMGCSTLVVRKRVSRGLARLRSAGEEMEGQR